MTAARGRPVRVVVGRGPDPSVRLTDALRTAAVWRGLRRPATARQGDTAVLVSCSLAAPAGVEVVRTLRELLTAHGLSPVLLAALPRRDRDAGWTVADVAARLGYDDLQDPWAGDQVVVPDRSSAHFGHPLPSAWLDARYRVVVSGCATDLRHDFALTLDALATVAIPVPGADEAETAAELLRRLPPHLAVVDATCTSHGPSGSAVPLPVRTDAVVVARSALLADLAGASLLGLDLAQSPIASACLATGAPPDFEIVGDLTPLPGLRRGSGELRRALRALQDASPAAARTVKAALGEAGPHADPDDTVLLALHRALEPWRSTTAETAVLEAGGASLLSAAAAAAGWWNAWRTSYGKDSLTRVTSGLGFDASAFGSADYEAVEDLLRPLESVIAAIPPSPGGLRWTRVGGSVLFEVTRAMRAPYQDWVERVDIAEAVSLMADYLGGRRVVVARDEQGRPVHQAERNIYLTQPNYLAFTGGRNIDVGKLELVRYGSGHQQIWWRTVCSPNGSAEHDDGSVEFADVGGSRTLVRVRGRQRFTLPAYWSAVDLDRTPELRDTLTADAYQRFFTSTLDNFAARYEGRRFRIGREAGEDEPVSRTLSRLLRAVGPAVEQWSAAADGEAPTSTDDAEPDDGFRHVRGPRG